MRKRCPRKILRKVHFYLFLQIELLSEDDELKSLPATKNETHTSIRVFSVQVTSHGKTWIVRRSFENFEFLDKQAHQCIFDRKYSQLNPIPQEENVKCQNGQSHKVRKIICLTRCYLSGDLFIIRTMPLINYVCCTHTILRN